MAYSPPLEPDQHFGIGDLGDQRIVALASCVRVAELTYLESHFKGTQYDSLDHHADGTMIGAPGDLSVGLPTAYVPIRSRRPSSRARIARSIVKSTTDMLFGHNRSPKLIIEGDDDAQDYVQELAEQSHLMMRMSEARNYGGSQGTAIMSFRFFQNKPRISVHNPRCMFPVEWADRGERRLSRVLECEKYMQDYVEDDGSSRQKELYSVRYWDEEIEIIWDPISREAAETKDWPMQPSMTVRHGFGFCPVYWIQNADNGSKPDGLGDYDASDCEHFSDTDRTLSQTTRGVHANGDPTLVMMEDPATRRDLEKGEGNVLWARGGASYLEISGTALQAGLDLFRVQKELGFDGAQVVKPDPELMAKAQSAAAMRMLYQPMLSMIGDLRIRYGYYGIIVLMTDMLKAARLVEVTARDEPGEIRRTAVGFAFEDNPSVVLPPRFDEKGNKKERTPGEGSNITLLWPAYFASTPADTERTVATATTANGGKPLMSHLSSIQKTADELGVNDPKVELEAIESEREAAVEELAKLGPPMMLTDPLKASPKAAKAKPKGPGEGEGQTGTSGNRGKDD